MGKLHAVLAVERPLETTANNLIAEATATFAGKSDRFLGNNKEVVYFDERRALENTTDSKQVVTTVDEKLDHVLAAISQSWDASYQKECGNQLAKANIVLDGVTIASGVPVTFLLGLESRLVKLREMVNAVPTLDPTYTWSETEGQRKGVKVSQQIVTHRTEKVNTVLTLAPPTDRHPAQVEKVVTDTNVAAVKTLHFSGMWPVERKAMVLDKLTRLIMAVRQARTVANETDAPSTKIADSILKVVFG